MKCSLRQGHRHCVAFACYKSSSRPQKPQRKALLDYLPTPQNQRKLASARLQAEAPSAEPLQAARPSFKPAAPADWEKLKQLQQENETVTIQIDSLRKTGAVFNLHGAEGFIYFDSIAYTRVVGRAPSDLVGKKLDVKIIIAEKDGRGLRASELARMAQEKAAQMSVGDVVEGIVSHCTDFGAFVRIGDGKDLSPVEGMIHISELSWNKVFTPESVVTPGTIVQCKLISVDKRNGKIGLSLKQMSPDPLKEQLETLLPEGENEQIATAPANVSQGIEKIVTALQEQSGINNVSLGRQVEEKAVSQELEIWMTKANVQAEQFTLIVREGRTVQEINVSASTSKDDMKDIVQRILQTFG